MNKLPTRAAYALTAIFGHDPDLNDGLALLGELLPRLDTRLALDGQHAGSIVVGRAGAYRAEGPGIENPGAQLAAPYRWSGLGSDQLLTATQVLAINGHVYRLAVGGESADWCW